MKLVLSLLGEFQLEKEGITVSLPLKAQAILAMLAAHDTPQPREKIAEYIWPARGEAQSRQSVRQGLLSIRKAVGKAAEDIFRQDITSGTLQLRGVEVDLTRFKQWEGPQDRKMLDDCASLYRGPFLAGFPEISPEFDSWTAQQRAHYSMLASSLLRRLALIQADEDNEEAAVSTANRLINLDPLREDVHRLLMQIYARFGRRAEALRQYDQCTQILRNELNVAPSGETSELARQLRATAKTPQKALAMGSVPCPVSYQIAATPARKWASSAAERRRLTVLHCQLHDSAKLSSQIDPEDLLGVVGEFLGIVSDAIRRFRGRIAGFSSDGVIGYFGYPVADENDAERSVQAALAALKGAQKLDLPVESHVTIGIATGLAIASDQAPSEDETKHVLVGEPVDVANELQANAPANSVAVCESTLKLLGRLFHAEELSPLPNPTGTQPRRAYQIACQSEIESRFEALRPARQSRFVARREEVEMLSRRWQEALRGEGSGVLISGEPGIGKSRLIDHLRSEVKGLHKVIQFHCSSLHSQSFLFPVIRQLRRSVGLLETDNDSERKRKLSLHFQREASDPDVPAIAELLDVSMDTGADGSPKGPVAKKESIIKTLLNRVIKQAEEAPLIIIAEDVHWADPSSIDLLDRLVTLVPEHRILLMITARPDFQPAWVDEPHMRIITLNRLGKTDSEKLVKAAAGELLLPKELINQILDRAGGIPLFLEEMTAMLVESSNKISAASGQLLHSSLLPENLQASLMARLDRLPFLKDVAQVGACAGREFAHELLLAACDLQKDEVEEGLAGLISSGLVRRQGTELESVYTFRHALIQDTAYESILKSRRVQLHKTIANFFLEKFKDKTQPEVIAHHLTLAKDYPRAVEFWLAAARKHIHAAADVEAVQHLHNGIAAAASIADQKLRRQFELQLHGALIGPLVATKGACAPEVVECCERGFALAAADDNAQWMLTFLYGRFTYELSTGNLLQALETADKFIKESRRLSDESGLVVGYRLAGLALLGRGEFRKAKEALKYSLSIYRPERDDKITYLLGQNAKVNSQAVLSLALFFLGDIKGAKDVGLEALGTAEKFKHPHSMAIAINYYGCWVLFLSGDIDEMLNQARRMVEVSIEYGLGVFATIGKFFVGLGLFYKGQRDAGIARMEKAVADCEAASFRLGVVSFMAWLAEAKCIAGRVAEAATLCAKAKSLMESCKEHWFRSEMASIEAVIKMSSDSKKEDAASLIKLGLQYAGELASPTMLERCRVRAETLHLNNIVT